MTRTLTALAAAAVLISGITAASAQAVYITDEAPAGYLAAPPAYTLAPGYLAPAPIYVAPSVYAVAPPVYAPPAPVYVPRGYASRPRMIYEAGYGYEW
jgi:hypothetical protein